MRPSLLPDSELTVAYAAGPGDVIGTYHHWADGNGDPNEASETYSGQFYSAIRDLSMTAYVISSHPRHQIVTENWITIEHRRRPSYGKTGLPYHVAELIYWLGVIHTVIRSNAGVAVIDDMEHWWLLSLLRLANVEVVPDLHCTFWPKGNRPLAIRHRILQGLNGWFWRNVPMATISISPECERQVLELAGPRVKGDLIQARPHYLHGFLDNIPAADWNTRPFRLLFAGRVERNKGIFDLLDVAERTHAAVPGKLIIEVCGSGSAEGEFIAEIKRRQLADVIHFVGQLDRQGMGNAYARSHAVVVPTLASFAEGLNRVVVESVLAGRPVIATTICPATEILAQSVIEVPPGDVHAIADALLRLASERDFYESKRIKCAEEGHQFYDADLSWGAALNKAIKLTVKNNAAPHPPCRQQ